MCRARDVQEPDARIVTSKSDDVVTLWSDHEGVALHGNGGDVDACCCVGGSGVVAGVFGGADEGLEGVAVEVEGVLVR